MPITFKKDTEQKLVGSIQRYWSESAGTDIGELQARLFLQFVLEEIAPSVYNAAISDAQAYMQEKVVDMDVTCFEHEFMHWNKQSNKVVRRKG